MSLKQSKDFNFTDQQIVHVFARLLEFMLLLSDKAYCHSDLKPENVTLVLVEGDNYVAKIIDFGELTNNQLNPKGYTANYFLNPMRE
jgi:serine/threonine protein kinase